MTPFLIPFAAFACAVVDGDTIKCHGQRYRLQRIDAAEMSEPAGPAARDFLRLLVDGKPVTCTWSRFDYYRRPLAECSVPGVPSLSDAMLEAGQAVPYRCCHAHPGRRR